MKFYFATSNDKKFAEVSEALGMDLYRLNLDLQELQETRENIVYNKLYQAIGHITHGYAIVDDTSLEMEGLYGFPGPYVKAFIKIGNQKLNAIAEAVGRKATAICLIGLACKNEQGVEYMIFEGATDGEIVESTGENFTFDSIFKPSGCDKTFGQMNMSEIMLVSHRGKAVRKLKEYLLSKV